MSIQAKEYSQGGTHANGDGLSEGEGKFSLRSATGNPGCWGREHPTRALHTPENPKNDLVILESPSDIYIQMCCKA